MTATLALEGYTDPVTQLGPLGSLALLVGLGLFLRMVLRGPIPRWGSAPPRTRVRNAARAAARQPREPDLPRLSGDAAEDAVGELLVRRHGIHPEVARRYVRESGMRYHPSVDPERLADRIAEDSEPR